MSSSASSSNSSGGRGVRSRRRLPGLTLDGSSSCSSSDSEDDCPPSLENNADKTDKSHKGTGIPDDYKKVTALKEAVFAKLGTDTYPDIPRGELASTTHDFLSLVRLMELGGRDPRHVRQCDGVSCKHSCKEDGEQLMQRALLLYGHLQTKEAKFVTFTDEDFELKSVVDDVLVQLLVD